MDDVQEFLTETDGFTGNPFMTKAVYINLTGEEEIRLALDILQRFGHELWDIDLDFPWNNALQFSNWINRSLTLIPNARSIMLFFTQSDVYDENWADFHLTPESFPHLQKLHTLSLQSTTNFDEFNVPELVEFINPMLTAFSQQLTTIHVTCFVFRGNPMNFQTFHFPNLTELKIEFDSFTLPRTDEIYANMIKLNCPNLRKLYFHGRIIITPATFTVFNHFRNSLVDLKILRGLGQFELRNIFQANPMDIQELPNIRCLTLTLESGNSELWHVFRVQLAKVKEIRFNPLYYNAEPLQSDTRQMLFSIFPSLQRIICETVINEGAVRGRDVVFTRIRL